MKLDPLFARLARPRLLRAFADWKVGRLDLVLPDGEKHCFGPDSAMERTTLHIRSDAFFRKFAGKGDLGAGESYMDGDWSSDDLPRFCSLVLRNREYLPLDTPLSRMLNLGNDLWHRLRANTRRGSLRNIHDHYDLSNEFFATFLDGTMTYSAACFDSLDQSLEEAQQAKYRRLAEKLQLRGEDHVLEIGCGWGGFASYAARHHGCRVTGITISAEQHVLARERIRVQKLEDRVEIRFQDFRELSGRFDKIVSIEMFEALGRENWARFFRKCEEVLAPDGLVALQAIAIPDHRFDEYSRHCDWLQRYIFPGSLLMSLHHATGAMIEAGQLGVVHMEDIGVHYAETLARWRKRFFENLGEVRRLGFDERFVRMWDYYLSVCEAAFATRTLGNYQLVLSRPGNESRSGIPARRVRAA